MLTGSLPRVRIPVNHRISKPVTRGGTAGVDLSQTIVAHVAATTFDDLSDQVVDVTKRSFLDALGVMIAASSLGEACEPFANIAATATDPDGATVLGFGFRAAPAMAAFANGSMAHSLDYEDTYDPALVHPNAAVVPAALALAETTPGVTGRDLLAAIAVGADLTCRLGLALKEGGGGGAPGRPLCGTLGATAAAGRLLGLTHEQLLHAFALSMFQSGSPARAGGYAGSHMRGVREAYAAQAGVVAAQLAHAGVKAFDTPFEGLYEDDVLLDGLGDRYESANVSFKPWPSCRGTHSFIEATLGLCSAHGLTLDSVSSVHVVISPFFASLCTPAERKQHPETIIDAKFSVPFTLGLALADQRVDLDSFAPARLSDPTVLDAARSVTHEVNRELSTREANHGVLTLGLRDGRSVTKEVVHPLGHPSNPMSTGDMAAKFATCVTHARAPLRDDEADRILGYVENLEESKELARLLG